MSSNAYSPISLVSRLHAYPHADYSFKVMTVNPTTVIASPHRYGSTLVMLFILTYIVSLLIIALVYFIRWKMSKQAELDEWDKRSPTGPQTKRAISSYKRQMFATLLLAFVHVVTQIFIIVTALSASHDMNRIYDQLGSVESYQDNLLNDNTNVLNQNQVCLYYVNQVLHQGGTLPQDIETNAGNVEVSLSEIQTYNENIEDIASSYPLGKAQKRFGWYAGLMLLSLLLPAILFIILVVISSWAVHVLSKETRGTCSDRLQSCSPITGSIRWTMPMLLVLSCGLYSLQLALELALADFCMQPDQYAVQVASVRMTQPETQTLDYYISCNDNVSSPMMTYVTDAFVQLEYSTQLVNEMINSANQSDPSLLPLLYNLSSSIATLWTYETQVQIDCGCDSVHSSYLTIRDSACDSGANNFFSVITFQMAAIVLLFLYLLFLPVKNMKNFAGDDGPLLGSEEPKQEQLMYWSMSSSLQNVAVQQHGSDEEEEDLISHSSLVPPTGLSDRASPFDTSSRSPSLSRPINAPYTQTPKQPPRKPKTRELYRLPSAKPVLIERSSRAISV